MSFLRDNRDAFPHGCAGVPWTDAQAGRRETMTLVRGSVVTLAGLAFASPSIAGNIAFFTEQQQFHTFVNSQGKVLKDVEDFEESTAPFGSKTPFPNSLQHGVPRPFFDNGIDATNLIIQTNITQAPCPPTPNPSTNPNALWVNGAGFIGSNSIKIGTDEFLNNLFSSIDLIFTTDEKTAIGVDVSTYGGFAQGHSGFTFCVYDINDVPMGSFFVPGPTPVEPSKNFFGVWSPTPIGRVNVWGHFGVPQPFAMDNIEMWNAIPAPGTAGVLGLLGAFALRRRR